jgi:hypothetical protein
MGHCICHLFVDEDYEPVEWESPPVREQDSPWPYITVYGAYWCKDTVRTVQYLNGHRIPYVFLDIDSDLAAAGKVMEWNHGNLSTPTLDIEGRIVNTPSNEELAGVLGLASEDQS